MFNSRRRRSFPSVVDMDDLRPLMLDPAEGEPDQHAVECVPEDLPGLQTESDLRTLREDRKAFRNILVLGLSFLLVFTSFNTNGFMTVSTVFVNRSCTGGCQLALPCLLRFMSVLSPAWRAGHLC